MNWAAETATTLLDEAVIDKFSEIYLFLEECSLFPCMYVSLSALATELGIGLGFGADFMQKSAGWQTKLAHAYATAG